MRNIENTIKGYNSKMVQRRNPIYVIGKTKLPFSNCRDENVNFKPTYKQIKHIRIKMN